MATEPQQVLPSTQAIATWLIAKPWGALKEQRYAAVESNCTNLEHGAVETEQRITFLFLFITFHLLYYRKKERGL